MGLYGKINRLPGEIFGSGHLWMVVWVFYTVQEIRCLSDLNFATVHKIGPRPSAVVYGDVPGGALGSIGRATHAFGEPQNMPRMRVFPLFTIFCLLWGVVVGRNSLGENPPERAPRGFLAFLARNAHFLGCGKTHLDVLFLGSSG